METFGEPRPIFIERDLASGISGEGNGTPIPIPSIRGVYGRISCHIHGTSISTISLRGAAFATNGMNLSGYFHSESVATYRVHVTRKTANSHRNIFGVTKDGASLSTHNLMAVDTAQLIDPNQHLYATFATRVGWATLDGFQFTARTEMRSVARVQVTIHSQEEVDAGDVPWITPSGCKQDESAIVNLGNGVFSHMRATVATLTPSVLFANASVGTLNPATFVNVLL